MGLDLGTFVDEVQLHFDRLTPDIFAREFVSGSNEMRMLYAHYLSSQSLQKQDLIREKIEYYSTPEGCASLDLEKA